jgi:molecular chaperone GrpE
MNKDKKHVEEEILELRNRISELENGWKRTQADFENYRKRTEESKPRWIEEANLEMIVKILPVIDNFERANQYIPENLKNHDWVRGIQLIEKHLNDILASTGLQKIAVKSGDEFDPNIHEAISSEENPQIKPDHIIEVVETGYKLGSQVIRPAKVRVSKGK